MAITGTENVPTLAPAVHRRLCALRGRIRWYVWLEGLTTAAAWLAVAFWASVLLDWFFEPPPAVRGTVLAIVAVGVGGVLFRLIGRRALVRLSDGNMATLLERRFPQLGDSLLTAVLLTGRRRDAGECSPEMLERTCRKAAERMRVVRLAAVLNPGPLRRSSIAALLLSASVVVFALLWPAAINTWGRRNLLMSNELWPRRTRLLIEGFDGRTTKVARGADLQVVAKADTAWPVVPKTVQVRYRTSGRKNKTMNREGTAQPGRDPFQRYACTIEGILDPVEFELVGGDARVRDLRIEPVDSPTVVEMALRCKYPGYMNRSERTLPVSGVMQIPQGTEVTVEARANKDLVRVQIDAVVADRSAEPAVTELEPGPGDLRRFTYAIPRLREDVTLLITLRDTDGITAREPVRLSLVAVADAPPRLDIQLDGIGQAVTAAARLPAIGRVTDDWGIAEARFWAAVDNGEPSSRPIGAPPADSTQWDLQTAMEVGELGLAPGQKLLVSVKATDHCDLAEQPNVGSSERWLLDVVTADQLRAGLEARELVLRQRLESIIEEVAETRDLLVRLDFAGGTANDISKEKAVAGSEPGDEPDDAAEPASPMDQLSPRTLRVQRATTNARKSGHETRGVGEAFDDIRKQLINNRIDTEELKRRLAEGIVAPLRSIANEMFPELERRLDRLQKVLADQQQAPNRAQRARQQADDILVAMRRVLERVIELEDFNEALRLLRSVIQLQDQLGEQTRERHKQKLRELLED